MTETKRKRKTREERINEVLAQPRPTGGVAVTAYSNDPYFRRRACHGHIMGNGYRRAVSGPAWLIEVIEEPDEPCTKAYLDDLLSVDPMVNVWHEFAEYLWFADPLFAKYRDLDPSVIVFSPSNAARNGFKPIYMANFMSCVRLPREMSTKFRELWSAPVWNNPRLRMALVSCLSHARYGFTEVAHTPFGPMSDEYLFRILGPGPRRDGSPYRLFRSDDTQTQKFLARAGAEPSPHSPRTYVFYTVPKTDKLGPFVAKLEEMTDEILRSGR
jgi:hypothetical protein